MKDSFPRILVGAFRGGAGKTMVSMGLVASLRSRGKRLSVFKKGPDYIDAAWLSCASGAPCYNLDTYLMGDGGVVASFERRTRGAEVALVEGNRGLFDGVDVDGRHSSAVLARLLGLSIFLVVDCGKSTRTIAALVKGCQVLEEDVRIEGVILNQVAGARHESILRSSIEKYCGVPVLGAIPRRKDLALWERHLGLFPPQEHTAARETVQALCELIEDHVDVDALLTLAAGRRGEVRRGVFGEAPWWTGSTVGMASKRYPGLRVGVIRDKAFHFYYPENMEALTDLGAVLLEIEAARDKLLPDIDGLYIGGGFPETQARELAENEPFRRSLLRAIERGLPVYAECGGAVYLGEGLEWKGRFYPFAGVFPVRYRLHDKPQGHGYTLLEVEDDNPMFPRGTQLKGHEFHYAGIRRLGAGVLRFACRVKRGFGFDGVREGLFYRNTYATFSHLHALGETDWAGGFLERAAAWSAGPSWGG